MFGQDDKERTGAGGRRDNGGGLSWKSDAPGKELTQVRQGLITVFREGVTAPGNSRSSLLDHERDW